MSNQRRNGFALPLALLLAVALLGFISIMLFNTRSQKGTHEMQIDQAQALTIARGVMQLAVYKYRMLPAEFIRWQDTTDPGKKLLFQTAWLSDFNHQEPTSPANRLKGSFQRCDDLGVATFSRIVLTTPGMEYTKDVLRIVTFAVVNGQRRTLEELLEFRLTDRH